MSLQPKQIFESPSTSFKSPTLAISSPTSLCFTSPVTPDSVCPNCKKHRSAFGSQEKKYGNGDNFGRHILSCGKKVQCADCGKSYSKRTNHHCKKVKEMLFQATPNRKRKADSSTMVLTSNKKKERDGAPTLYFKDDDRFTPGLNTARYKRRLMEGLQSIRVIHGNGNNDSDDKEAVSSVVPVRPTVAGLFLQLETHASNEELRILLGNKHKTKIRRAAESLFKVEQLKIPVRDNFLFSLSVKYGFGHTKPLTDEQYLNVRLNWKKNGQPPMPIDVLRSELGRLAELQEDKVIPIQNLMEAFIRSCPDKLHELCSTVFQSSKCQPLPKNTGKATQKLLKIQKRQAAKKPTAPAPIIDYAQTENHHLGSILAPNIPYDLFENLRYFWDHLDGYYHSFEELVLRICSMYATIDEQLKQMGFQPILRFKQNNEWIMKICGDGTPFKKSIQQTTTMFTVSSLNAIDLFNSHCHNHMVCAFALKEEHPLVIYYAEKVLVPDMRKMTEKTYKSRVGGGNIYLFWNATETACTINELKSNTAYEFAVKVVSGQRSSTWSMSILNVTKSAAPSSAPRDLTVIISNDPLTVILSWQPPKHANGPITEYVIYYNTDPHDTNMGHWALKGNITGYALTTIIGNLQSRTTYYFKIQARNEQGFGPLSRTVSYTTQRAVMNDELFCSSDGQCFPIIDPERTATNETDPYCYNEYACCSHWKKEGYCDINDTVDFVENNCKAACGICSPDLSKKHRGCKDYDSHCRSWAENGGCINDPLWMAENCRKSCKFCSLPRSTGCDALFQWVHIGFVSLDSIKKPETEVAETHGLSMSRPKIGPSAIRPREAVTALTGSTFDRFIAEKRIVLVDFYAPWCGHCQRLAPIYLQAAQQLMRQDQSLYLAKVDATVEQGLAREFGINSYPTLILFRNGQRFTYTGQRTLQAIKSYMLAQSAKVVPKPPTRTTAAPRVGPTAWPSGSGGPLGGPAKCFNEHPCCPAWKTQGKCSTNKEYMDENCKAVCGVCSPNYSTGGCRDYNTKYCTSWARDGQCQSNKFWMEDNCRKSCNLCSIPRDKGCGTDTAATSAPPDPLPETGSSECFNEFPCCTYWAKQGQCRSKKSYMNENCKAACGLCTPLHLATVCRDIKHMCASWATNGECTKNAFWMAENCRKSCNLCHIPRDSGCSSAPSKKPTTRKPPTPTRRPSTCSSRVEGACDSCVGGIKAYPSSMPNAHFYKRICYSRKGLKIVASSQPSGASMHRAAFLLDKVMENVDPRVVRNMNMRHRYKHAIMAAYPRELTTHIPEHSFLEPGYWNERARGLGGTTHVPTGSSAEENLMCHSNDRYRGEDITIHEFSHGLHLLGLASTFPSFDGEVTSLYNAIRRNPSNPWAGTYAMTNKVEYFAEAVQSYFDANNNGGSASSRSALRSRDPNMYNLVRKYLGEVNWKWHC